MPPCWAAPWTQTTASAFGKPQVRVWRIMWRRHCTGAARLTVAAGSLAQRVSADGVHSYRGEPFGALGLPSSVVAYIGEHGRTRGDAPYITAIAADGEASELTYGALDLLTGGVAGWVARNHPAGTVL